MQPPTQQARDIAIRLYETGGEQAGIRYQGAQQFLGDAEQAARRFHQVVEFSQSWGLPMYVAYFRSEVADETFAVPVDLPDVLSAEVVSRLSSLGPSRFIESAQDRLRSLGLSTEPLAPELSTQPFVDRLTEFVDTRLAARTANQQPGGTLPFSVSTQAHGLRVWSCPAVLVNQGTVYGSPTSPVPGYLRPGRYIFGADGPTQPFVWDNGQFKVPGPSATLTAV